MNIYEYNSSSINEYLEEDFGYISLSPNEVLDCNEISEIENYGSITCKETLVPFGSIKVSENSGAHAEKSRDYSVVLFDTLKTIRVVSNIKKYWIGFSILFELNSSLIRKLIPDVSGG